MHISKNQITLKKFQKFQESLQKTPENYKNITMTKIYFGAIQFEKFETQRKILVLIDKKNKFSGSFPFPIFKFSFEKLIQCCHNAMKFNVLIKSTTVNRVVLQSLHYNIASRI